MFVNEISDDYLICLCREKNQDALDLLFERYRRYSVRIIQRILKSETAYYDYEEMFQDSMLILIKCLERYDEDSGCFYYFFKKSIERRVIDEIKRVRFEKTILSLDNLKYDNGNSSYVDCVAEENNDDYMSDLYDCLIKKLKAEEKCVVDLRLEGYSYTQIANLTGSNRQSVYRKAVKIKNILKDTIEKID